MLKCRCKIYLVLCCWASLTLRVNAQPVDIIFDHITQEDGLSYGFVTSIYKDYDGFLWFGTKQGLNKYDGTSIQSFLHVPGDSNSISGNNIYGIAEDADTNLWICLGRKGICRFDRTYDRFLHYPIQQNEKSEPVEVVLNSILLPNGEFWVGTNQGIFRYNADLEAFESVIQEGDKGLLENYVMCFYIDAENYLWIGNWNGLNRYNISTGSFEYYRCSEIPGLIGGVMTMAQDDLGRLWLGSIQEGLAVFDFYKRESKTIDDLPYLDKTIRCIEKDTHGNIWAGGAINSLLKIEPESGNKTYYSFSHMDKRMLSDGVYTFLHYDRDRIMWIGSIADGIQVFDENSNIYKYVDIYQYFTNKNEKLSDVKQDKDGNIWAITFGDGVYRFDNEMNYKGNYLKKELKTVKKHSVKFYINAFEEKGQVYFIVNHEEVFVYDKDLDKMVPFEMIKEIDTVTQAKLFFAGNFGNRWVISEDHLLYNNALTGVVKDFSYLKKERKIDYTGHSVSLSENKDGVLLIASEKGLFGLNPDTDEIKQILAADIEVIDVQLDDFETLWISTAYGFYKQKGLNNAPEKVNFLSTNEVGYFGKLVYHKPNIWLHSNQGFFCINTETSEVSQYDFFRNLRLNKQVFSVANNGDFLVGGVTSFYRFSPEELMAPSKVPKIKLTSFYLSGEKQYPGKVIKKSIVHTSQMKLKHYQNSFSFDFSVLNFSMPKENIFAWMLEGYDNDWNLQKGGVNASYTKVPPGKYVFLAKGANHKGIWNEEGVRVEVLIKQPYWNTLWFKALMVICLVALIFVIYRIRVRNLKIRQRHLEETVKSRTKEINKQKEHIQMALDDVEEKSNELQRANNELAKMVATKDRFFSILAHDLKNPFQQILGFSELLKQEIKKKSDETMQKYIGIVSSASKETYNLLESLLQWARSQSEQIQVEKTEVLISDLLSCIVELVSVAAKNKNIVIRTENNFFSTVLVDANMLATVLRNILSNAIKFSHPNSEILVETFSNDNELSIIIKDNGVGMDQETVNQLFEIDKGKSTDGTSGEKGSGLGLIISKEFLDKNDGMLLVESKTNIGTKFTILLPILKLETEDEDASEELIENKEGTTYREKTVLVVEDNPNIRLNLEKILGAKYNFFEAEEGQKGFEKAIEIMPDIIISDVMMPGMNGFELCAQLKSDNQTSHIPVILLTAKTSDASKMVGLETGADDYITKPFNSELLLVRVHNLIHSREQLKKRFQKEVYVEPKEVTVNSRDEEFMTKVSQLFEENYTNPAFDSNTLFEKTGMSRSVFSKKLKALTDMTPGEFISVLRLKKAAQLLEKSEMNVSEIAYAVGYNDRSNFTRSFTNQFNMSPSDFRKKQ